ncbi:hypothetical protein ACFXDE_31790 [Kitasatospora sp. NPDC059408]|uniref:hypothetical protein n=1 Tax=Kitasatospora sp. NPDC059408 TaxID=3346823 RepID=UPI0036D16375
MSTPHPDAAPTPGADQTVRLGPGTGEGEETSRTDAAEATTRLGGVSDPRADRTVRLPRSPLGGPDAVETVRLDKEEGLRLTGESGTVPLPRPPLGGPDVVETVRLDNEERLRLTGEGETVRFSRPPLGGPDAVETVRLDKGESGTVPLPRSPLGAPDPRADRTVRLSSAPAPAATPDAEATVRLDSAEAESATFLDPRVWGGAPGESVTLPEPIPLPEAGAEAEAESATFLDPRVWGGAPGESATLPEPIPLPEEAAPEEPAPEASVSTPAVAPDEHPLAPGELRRFGPGVPPQAAAAWHGETPADRKPKRPRRVRRWLVPVAVLLAVLALLFWRFHTTALAVTSVGVTTDPAGPGCGGTAVVTASVETNGGAGSIRYRWQRSDGTTSDELVQDVRSGTRHTDLVLRWTFDGQGSLQATATLQILSPGTRTATATFPYHCSQ